MKLDSALLHSECKNTTILFRHDRNKKGLNSQSDEL